MASHWLSQFFSRYKVVVALAATTLYLFVADEGSLIKCPIRLLTGYQCPGCGSQRSLRALFAGDFVGALQLNALIYLAPLFMLWLRLARGKASYQIQKNFIIATSAVLVVVSVIAKNHLLGS